MSERAPTTAETRLSVRPDVAAGMLGISRRTLRYWSAAGRVPCIRVKNVTLYPVRWLERFVGGARKMRAEKS